MLAFGAQEFLYTAIPRCKAPPNSFSYIIVIREVADPRRGASFDGERSRRALTFLARERGLLTSALKTFETVLFG